MTEDEYKWQIDLVQARYRKINLTFQQAEKVYVFEKETDLSTREYWFSPWEEFDFMLDNFRKILDDGQFKKYQKWHRDKVKKHEQFLIETDKEQVDYINYYNELTVYYEQKYIPDLVSHKFLLQSVILSDQKGKISYLKGEYQKYLNNQKVGNVSAHYRHYRLFKPNALAAILLRHKLSCLLPSYAGFKAKMDAPTEAIAKFLLHEFNYLPEKFTDFFKKEEEETAVFLKELKRKYIEKPDKGYFFLLNADEQAKKESQIMQIVLFEKDQYNW